MKTAKTILMAILIAGISASLAQAGSTIRVNSSTYVKANVKNTTRNNTSAAVKMTGYDDAGVIVGKLCKKTTLYAGKTAAISFAWKAPSYPTGIYWSTKVEPNKSCP